MTEPSQFIRLDTPEGPISFGYGGQWPPPELVEFGALTYQRKSFSLLDTETVTNSRIVRGALYELAH